MYGGYTYETGETWLPPLKRAVVDAGGHLRLGYWKGNEKLKAEPLEVDGSTFRQIYPAAAEETPSCGVSDGRLDMQAQPERTSILRADIPTTIAVLDTPWDFRRGVILEGTLQATCRDRRLVASSIGFYLQESAKKGTAILLHGYGRTEIGRIDLAENVDFRVEDSIGPGCAAPAGVLPHTDHTFRLLIRRNMFEFYLDDLLVQTFNTTHEPNAIGRTPARVGFVVQNGLATFRDVKAWTMSLDESP
jgi:hypothetical protein